MLKRFGHVLLIVALLAATGSHWAVLQSVAWTTMLADNLRGQSFTEAILRTFDGKHPCRLCCQIQEGRKSEQKTDLPLQLQKLEFIPASTPFVLNTPELADLTLKSDKKLSSLLYRPPTPPPRVTPA